MQKYKDFRPTAFDAKGLGLEDRQNWLVLGVSVTRDSDELAASNFAVAQAILDSARVKYEVHRFGHWGPGWFEIILIEPDFERAGEDIESALASYPVLSDEHFGAVEEGEADSVLERIRQGARAS